MSQSSLLLNNKQISYKQIKSGEYDTCSPFEERTLLFCRQWLNRQEVFEQHTSGSTGKPKLIKISQAQMIFSAQNTVDTLKLRPSDTALVCIDTAYIGGKMMLVRAFEHKLQLIIIEPSSHPLENITESVDFIAMVPMQFENTLNNHPEKIENCKAIIIGGAPINNFLAKKVAELKTPIYSTYGMTETVSHIALKRLSSPSGDYFKTLGNITINVTNKEQLIINGAITNYQDLITNDIVEIVSSTEFKWIGRSDNVVNTGGVKIQLEEVESLIEIYFNKINLSNRFFLYGVSDSYLGQKLVLCIEANNITIQMNTINLSSIGINKLSCPKDIIYIKQFIESTSGKVDRAESYKNR